jgi:hypothetical protein
MLARIIRVEADVKQSTASPKTVDEALAELESTVGTKGRRRHFELLSKPRVWKLSNDWLDHGTHLPVAICNYSPRSTRHRVQYERRFKPMGSVGEVRTRWNSAKGQIRPSAIFGLLSTRSLGGSATRRPSAANATSIPKC